MAVITFSCLIFLASLRIRGLPRPLPTLWAASGSNRRTLLPEGDSPGACGAGPFDIGPGRSRGHIRGFDGRAGSSPFD